MIREELKKRALSLIQLPDHYEAEIEEYMEGENGEGEALFAWTNKERDQGISVTLDLSGNLISLSIDKEDEENVLNPLDVNERRKLAEQFLNQQYPDALQQFTYNRYQKLSKAIRFHYEQFVMDLPLPYAGCFVDVNAKGEVIQFSFDGLKTAPNIPARLIDKQHLLDDVKERLSLDLVIKMVYKNLYDVHNSGLYMVYELESPMEYRADQLQPTLTIIREEEERESYVPLPVLGNKIARFQTLEETIGIPDNMEIIREVDMGDETGVVWRDRNWKNKEKDLSINGFFHEQNDGTVKAFLSKETGKIRSFMWFAERKGDLSLNREECYQRGVDFLTKLIPDYMPYLEQIVHPDDEEDRTSRAESFSFRVHNGHGVSLETEIVMVSVNRTTGEMDHYNGPSFSILELEELPNKPKISETEAKEIFCQHLDFELAWKKDYDSDDEAYNLVYRPCERDSRKRIRYINAITGEIITDR
ncbi:DUF4901 domain-containing protein [Radiobacillus kanasensis]|uniref:YcdB/YcdC domain-containing protein n=1 Tax=Radiobacillus kanasensis TaxID=2844358 RepID=UPI001E64665B|nr:YcdB/YcdC domain-containing protein [Radiobacillus kanasensis]UFT98374.1 DUF4901 domain-containing protein [Radiobacillus kanasensis]